MKKILLAFILIASFSYSQNVKYEYESAYAGGMLMKLKGFIEVKDSVVTIEASTGEKSMYKLVASSNNTTYFTDGVMTNYFIVQKGEGKKKGYTYDHSLFYYTDKKFTNPVGVITYYCKKVL